jgi:hypothetical protein
MIKFKQFRNYLARWKLWQGYEILRISNRVLSYYSPS